MDKWNVCFYYQEPEKLWIARGYAKNLFLYVDYKTRSFEVVRSYCYITNKHLNDIEVKRKSVIYDYASFLLQGKFTDFSTNKVKVI